MLKSPSPYLQHILESITNVQDFLSQVGSKERFLSNRMVQSAVVRELEIVGEAAAKLEAGFRESHPNIPWRQIVAMRNRLTHEYWDVDLDKIYNVCTGELLELKKEVVRLLASVGE